MILSILDVVVWCCVCIYIVLYAVFFFFFFFFFKQKTAYEIVSRDWSSDVCSSDLSCNSDALVTKQTWIEDTVWWIVEILTDTAIY